MSNQEKQWRGTITRHVNKEGLVIEEVLPAEGFSEEDRPEGIYRFIAEAKIPQVNERGALLGCLVRNLPIEAQTLDDAFEQYNKMIEQQKQRSKLILPS